jgi:hypothetical protein
MVLLAAPAVPFSRDARQFSAIANERQRAGSGLSTAGGRSWTVGIPAGVSSTGLRLIGRRKFVSAAPQWVVQTEIWTVGTEAWTAGAEIRTGGTWVWTVEMPARTVQTAVPTVQTGIATVQTQVSTVRTGI